MENIKKQRDMYKNILCIFKESEDENFALSPQDKITFDAKKFSDIILQHLMGADPGKFKRYSKSNLVFENSEEFNFKLTSSEANTCIDYYINLLKEEIDGHLPRASQLKVLEDASNNFKPAVNYLYCRYLRLIANVYNDYYVDFIKRGNPTTPISLIRTRDSVATAREIAFSILSNNRMLSNNKKGASAYDSFKTEVYNDQADLLYHFGEWAIGSRIGRYSKDPRGFGYFTASMISMAKKFNSGGLTGGEDDDTRVDSLDDKMEMNRYNEPYEDSHEDQVNASVMVDEISQFLKSAKNSNPKFSMMFDYIRKGYSMNDIAKKMGISREYADRIWDRTRKFLRKEYNSSLNESLLKKLFNLEKLN